MLVLPAAPHAQLLRAPRAGAPPLLYYYGQESLRRNGVSLIVNKRVQNEAPGCNLRNDRMISVHFQSKTFSITVIQVYAPTSNAEEAEIKQFYEDHKTS